MADDVGYLKARPGAAAYDRRGRKVDGHGPPLRRVLACLLAFFGVAPVFAQAPANTPVVRFSVFSLKPLKDVAFAPRAGAPAQPVAFYATARSPRYEYRGAMPLRFVDATTEEVIAEANVPADIRNALLLFSAVENPAGAAKSPLRYQIAVLDDGPARHGVGGLAIINLSGLSLNGTINKQGVTLRAGLNPTAAVGRSAVIVLRTTAGSRTHQAYSATVPLTTKQRALLILFPPFYKGSLEVQSRLLIDEPPGAR